MSLALAVFLASAAVAAEPARGYLPEETEALRRIGAPQPYPEEDSAPPKQVELGRKLAFDPRLSSNGAVSCMSCHQPAQAFTDGLSRARGVGHAEGPRNTPSLLNLHYRRSFFWDGRAKSVEEALLDAIKNPVEMNQDHTLLAARLAAIPGYAAEFEEAFGKPGVTVPAIAAALGAFVRAIDVAYAEKLSPFDRFRDDPGALSPSARAGLVLFAGKARCVECHGTNHFADDAFHDVGLSPLPGIDDKGRGGRREFKTPSLRQAALTGPYMHDGRFATLSEVVDFFDRGGDRATGRDPAVRPLGLSVAERAALVDFLRALSAPTPAVTIPALHPL